MSYSGINLEQGDLPITLKLLDRSMDEAIKQNSRRMIVLMGHDNIKLCFIAGIILRRAAEKMAKRLNRDKIQVIYALKHNYEDAKERLKVISSLMKDFTLTDFEEIDYADTEQVLGTTYDLLVLDLINDLRPNDIGRLIGIVRGGGLIVLVTPHFDEWEKRITEFQELLSTPQHPVNEVRHIFKKRFIKKLLKYPGIAVYDVDKDKLVKEPGVVSLPTFKRRSLMLPEKGETLLRAYKMALTQDQIEVVKIIEKLSRRPEKGEKYIVVITADRGRGKSCAVGIGLAILAHKLRKAKGRVFIGVTAPALENVQSLMMLARRTLEAMGYKTETIERRRVIERIKARGITIEYMRPLDLLSSRPDIVAVDEAAGLQVPMLHKIWRLFDRIIFSSTIHGYEGAGRGFSIRFLKRIKEDKNTKLFEYEMNEPIRYANNDPIELWLFDTLLLDAEPAPLTEKDYEYIKSGEVKYIAPNIREWFLEDKENELRQFVGIYILAHYRNRPNDIAMMADAPHHTIRALKLPSNKIVTAVELAEEGPIPEDMIDYLKKGGWIHGNIIPDRFLKHLRDERFARYAGWRIVRIATHPNAMSLGLGSRIIEFICDEAIKRGYGWVGAGFGVNEPLLRFWLKNNFIPIHISPDRNPVSGEYTVLVIRPLKEEVKKIILQANREFRIKLLNSLVDPYDDLDPYVARLLLFTWNNPVFKEYKPRLTEIQVERVASYAWSGMTYECVSDCVRELTLAYFYNDETNRPKLSEKEELILITKVLQARSWRACSEVLGMHPQAVMDALREITRVLVRYYYGISGA